MNAINNFINVGKVDSNGENVPVEESLPVYGIYWKIGDRICVFEVNDYTNPMIEIDELVNGNEPEFKNIIFDGTYDENGYYVDNSTNVVLNSPCINIVQINESSLSYIQQYMYDEGDEYINSICEKLGINNGFMMGRSIQDSYIWDFAFIISPGELTEDKYDGFGIIKSQLL